MTMMVIELNDMVRGRESQPPVRGMIADHFVHTVRHLSGSVYLVAVSGSGGTGERSS